MALSSVADFKNAMRDGSNVQQVYFKRNVASAYYLRSNWQGGSSSTLPGNGTVPAANTGVALGRSSDGATQFRPPRPGNKLYLVGIDFRSSNATGVASFMVYDRLWHAQFNGASPGTITGDQAPTRYTDGIGNHLMLETSNNNTGNWTTSIGYTNENGVSGRTTNTQPAYGAGATMLLYGLDVGDRGVQSVQTWNCSVSASSQLFVMMRPILWGSLVLGQPVSREFIGTCTDVMEINENACLTYAYTDNNGAVAVLDGYFTFVEG